MSEDFTWVNKEPWYDPALDYLFGEAAVNQAARKWKSRWNTFQNDYWPGIKKHFSHDNLARAAYFPPSSYTRPLSTRKERYILDNPPTTRYVRNRVWRNPIPRGIPYPDVGSKYARRTYRNKYRGKYRWRNKKQKYGWF